MLSRLSLLLRAGIRNTTTMFDPTQRGRVRHTRYIGSDNVLRPYDPDAALGAEWLHQVRRNEAPQPSLRATLYFA